MGFQFLGTRVLGVGWPGFRNFPEWNLRFYVSHQGRRGVCFVREFVPQWSVATLARVIYNEPYRSARMTMDVTDAPDALTAHYTLTWAGRVHSLRAVARPAVRPGPDSPEHWFKEHAWGFGTSRRGRLIRYEVSHPEWDVYPVREFAADVDWAALSAGPEWAAMSGTQPADVVLAAGSEVAVFPKG